MNNLWSTLLTQLDGASVSAPGFVKFQPRPAGVIVTDSASDVVLKCMREMGGWVAEGQVRYRTGLNHARASWALLYLTKIGLVESRQDTTRNSRYRRYKVVVS